MSIKVLNGDCLEVLDQLPEKSVDTCITSPPYYGLRDYEREGQIGLEETPEEYVDKMVEVFRKVRRVLKDEGTVWLNLGDSYASNHYTGARDSDTGCKPNPMPESVQDRCTKAHEYIFLLTKQKKYYYDNDAIREPHTWKESKPRPSGMERNAQKYRAKVNYGGAGSGFAGHSGSLKADGTSLNHPDGRNKRSVWTVTTKPFTGAHFAVFPPDLITPCVLAGCPKDGTVLDPFGGAGTTGLVADRNGRNAILIELNDEYAEMSRDRLYNDAPLFVDVE